MHIGEGKLDFDGEAAIGRIPVISASGIPLMPCKPAKARKLLRDGKAIRQWNKLGIFYIQLKFEPAKPVAQLLALGIDTGSKFEGFSVVGTKDTVLNLESEAATWVKKAVEQRRTMRHHRRSNLRRRPARFDNRRGSILPPSTKARRDNELRIIIQLQKILPISVAVVEDIKAVAKKGQKKWNINFSPLESGKEYFYTKLQLMKLRVILKTGYDTKALREQYGLKKLNSKSKPVFEAHCVDAWVLAASKTGATYPTTRGLYYLVPLRWHRRQLHRLQPEKGGIRKRYGGTMSLGLKRGVLVKHISRGLCYIGGNIGDKLSLHSFDTGRRLTQKAHKSDVTLLTKMAFRTRFLSADMWPPRVQA